MDNIIIHMNIILFIEIYMIKKIVINDHFSLQFTYLTCRNKKQFFIALNLIMPNGRSGTGTLQY